MIEGLDEVPSEENQENSDADCKSDENFLPGEGFPIGLEVVDQAGDRDAKPAEHDEEEQGFPENTIDNFLPCVGGDEARGFSVHEPGDCRHPEWSDNADHVNEGGSVTLGGGGFGAIRLEGHTC